MHRPSIPSTWRSVMVLQFAARIQLNLSLLTVSLHSCCSKKKKKKMERKWLTNHIACLRLPPKWKVTWGHLFKKKKKKPLIRGPCCDEVSWQHGPSWKKALCSVWSVKQQPRWEHSLTPGDGCDVRRDAEYSHFSSPFHLVSGISLFIGRHILTGSCQRFLFW